MKSSQSEHLANTVNSSSNRPLNNLFVSDQHAKTMASNIYQQLQDQGYRPRDIISVSSQLIDLITQQLGKGSA